MRLGLGLGLPSQMSSGAVLSFTGSTVVAENASVVLATLVVRGDPLGLYDTFAETADPDNKFTLAGAVISGGSFDYETATSHTSSYQVTQSGDAGAPALTLTINWTLTNIAPVLVSVVPADDATGVAIGADLVITWDETVISGIGSVYLMRTSDDAQIDEWVATAGADAGAGAGQYEISGGAVTFHPTTDRDNDEEYYVLWDAGVFTDAGSNGVAGQASTTAYSFTTVALGSYVPTYYFLGF